MNEQEKPKRIFNVDDIDLAIGTIGCLRAIAIGVTAWKLTGSAAGTAAVGIFGTAATGIGSLARRRKPTPAPTPIPTGPGPGPFGPIYEPLPASTGGKP